MENQSFILFLSVCVITHIIRTVYEVLKHKKKLEPNRISFIIIFINMAVLWISWVALCNADINKIAIPGIIQYVGLVMVITGLILFITALFTIKTLETYDGDLITKGVYSKIRHPMYLGFLLWLIGFPVYFGGMFSFIVAFLFSGNVLFWRYLEETELVKRFPDYKVYRTKTIF